MLLRFHINRPKRELIPMLVLLFLLQSIAPAFQGVMAQSIAGYTDIVCTMHGTRLVFVPLGEQPRQIPPACDECPACILQLSADDATPPGPTALAERTRHRPDGPAPALQPALESRHCPLFLSRAPPA